MGVPILKSKLLSQTTAANFSTLPAKTEFYKTLPITISEDAILLVPELVHKYGYPCESHTVITSDGYILTMHRISHGSTGVTGQKKFPVYLQHGLLSSSADWLLAGPEKSLVFYVMCSEKPEYNEKIKVQMSLAPVGFLDHIRSPLIRFLLGFETFIKMVTNLLGIYNILSVTKFSPIIGQLLCSDQSVTQFLCINLIFLLFGFNPRQMNSTLLPVIFGHTPAGVSTKQIYHYVQEIHSGKFENYDYGPMENTVLYNSVRPPSYIMEKITAPVYLYYSINDFLSSDIDVKRLQTRLPNVIDAILNPDSKFNHGDYLYGINAKKVLYEPLIENMLNIINLRKKELLLGHGKIPPS
ncbi:hypothetical protein FQR65_LT07494 [Abscondita terminalis]|nr:hypothetical protein FQR65_LT07494 [Abscondita terminalis]